MTHSIGSTQTSTSEMAKRSAALDLVRLTPLMERTAGRPEILIALIDGPVAMDHPDLAAERIREIPGKLHAKCTLASGLACMHGTFMAGILSAKKSSPAPAICPNCTLLVRPIFAETTPGSGRIPSATPQELAAAIIDCIEAGARLINLSVALAQPSPNGQPELQESLDYAASRGLILAAAAGNQGTLGTSTITRHPGVIPVAACDLRGRPLYQSNLGSSIGRRGVSAPGEDITSLGTRGTPLTLGGTSAATPFVTGTIALLRSEFPAATATEIRFAVTGAQASPRAAVVPLLLDAWAAYQFMLKTHPRR